MSSNSQHAAVRDPGAKASARTLLPDVLQFMQLLWALVHGLERRSKRMAADFGVTGPQRLVLRVVGLVPGVSAGDLATILHVHPSTLTGILQRLSAQRLITRLNHPRDRRRVVLYLTTRGTRINALNRGTVEASIAQALSGASARDRAATRRVLDLLTQHLGPADELQPSSEPQGRGRGAARARISRRAR